jgi:hypothetical protein
LSGQAKRAVGVVVVTVLVLAALGLYSSLYLANVPGSSAAVRSSAGVELDLATVAASTTNDPHPSWVSYYAVDSGDHHWRHDTTYVLPANTLVHVKILQFDGQSGLRNPYLSQVAGTVGGNFLQDGKPTRAIGADTASHVFAIPQIGLSVPLEGVPDDAKNPCANAPCPLSTAHYTIEFTFRTPGPGLYRWQCFVPCAAGYIDGFGGPMQTVGYMDGFIKVV